MKYKAVTWADVFKDAIVNPGQPPSDRDKALHRRFREDAERQLEREAEDREWGKDR